MDRDELVAQRFDTIVCINVLEHIENDFCSAAAVSRLVAATNGKVLIWVPVVQAAYGPLDAALGHHRRYTKRTLRARLRRRRARSGLRCGIRIRSAARWMTTRSAGTTCTHRDRSTCSRTSSRRGRCRSTASIAPPIGLSLFAVGRPASRRMTAPLHQRSQRAGIGFPPTPAVGGDARLQRRETIEEIIRRVLAVQMRIELIVVDDVSTMGRRRFSIGCRRSSGFVLLRSRRTAARARRCAAGSPRSPATS